jgi:maltooligosyltrehalose trehalohydrolase
MWARDYHVDGLRIDAVAVVDLGARHVLAEMAERVRAARPRTLLIAESDLNDPRVIRPKSQGGWGLDAQWADDFHHALHALVTGERDGYYADFGRVADLGACFHRPYLRPGKWSAFRRRAHGAPAGDRAPIQFVVYAQNHDQVGNRALGDRLPARARRLATFCVMLSPFLPLLFMGDEHGEERPFLYFTDHTDPLIDEAAREGRRRELAAVARAADEAPDAQDPETLARSVPAPGFGDPAAGALLADLVRLRRRLGGAAAEVVAVDEAARTLVVRRGDVALAMCFADRSARVPLSGELLLAVGEAAPADGVLELGPLSAAAVDLEASSPAGAPARARAGSAAE